MLLKTSYFNKGIFKSNLKRFWLIPFSYAFFLFMYIIGYLGSEIDQMNRATNLETLGNIGRDILGSGNDVMILLLGFFPLAAALAVFSYMHFPKNTAMIHSLPVNRGTLFVTNYLSGLFIISAPLLLNSLILIVTEAIVGIPNPAYAWIWLGLNTVMTLLLYNFAVFTGMFTGHLAAHAIFFYILNFLSLFLRSIIVSILNDFLFGYVSDSSATAFEIWSPLDYINTLYRSFRNNEGSIAVLAGYLITAFVLLVLSYFLYKKRHMEVATDVISFAFIKPVFKYSAAFCSAGLIGSIIISVINADQHLGAYIVSYLIGGFIGYFAAEMLMRKTFKVFKAYNGYLVFAAVLSLFLCSIDFDLYGYERRVPQDNQVEVIGLNTYMDPAMRLALRPEDYDPDKHSYLFPTREYLGEYIGEFAFSPPEQLSGAQVKELRESMAGISENRQIIEKVLQIHSYIVENEGRFKDNERLQRRDTLGRRAGSFQNRPLYFVYRLEDGSLLQRRYSLLTYSDNTQLDELLREYLSLPGVREGFEPVLIKNAQDIRSIFVSFETKDGRYHDFEITENIGDFLNAYKKDILASDSLCSMFGNSEPNDYSVNVGIEFYGEYFNRRKSYGGELNNSYENTLNYLVERGVFELENLMPSDYTLKHDPASIAVPR